MFIRKESILLFLSANNAQMSRQVREFNGVTLYDGMMEWRNGGIHQRGMPRCTKLKSYQNRIAD